MRVYNGVKLLPETDSLRWTIEPEDWVFIVHDSGCHIVLRKKHQKPELIKEIVIECQKINMTSDTERGGLCSRVRTRHGLGASGIKQGHSNPVADMELEELKPPLYKVIEAEVNINIKDVI